MGAAIGHDGVQTWNPWMINIAPPDLNTVWLSRRSPKAACGRSSRSARSGAFVSWALREVEICNKLGIGYHVPVRVRRGDLRLCDAGRDPAVAARRLGTRLPLRHLQPSALGVEPATSICTSTTTRRICWRSPSSSPPVRAGAAWRADPVGGQPALKGEEVKTPEHEDTFFRDFIGYSIGTLGIHRLGLILALNAGFWSAVCIVISAGPIYGGSWIEWWEPLRNLSLNWAGG
jgi:photosynthetic reaction center L subunit